MFRRLRAAAGAATLVSLLAAAASLAALAAAPAALAGDPCFHGYSIPPATTATSTSVVMEPCAFVPTNVIVPTGATVTFTNASGDVHLLTGANQAWGDREREIRPGERVSATFDEPGVYAFSCALHRGMSGAVIVDAASVAAAGVLPAGEAGSAGQAGLDAQLAIAVLAAVAVAGWGIALQRRRVAQVRTAPRSPIA